MHDSWVLESRGSKSDLFSAEAPVRKANGGKREPLRYRLNPVLQVRPQEMVAPQCRSKEVPNLPTIVQEEVHARRTVNQADCECIERGNGHGTPTFLLNL